MTISRYFKEGEFNRCSPSCSLQDMKQSTMSKLDTAREIAQIPFVLTSAYRSREWEQSKRRSGTGAHTLGQAVDIRCSDSRSRFLMVSALIKSGFNRVGIAQSYIHADDSQKHDQQVIWLY